MRLCSLRHLLYHTENLIAHCRIAYQSLMASLSWIVSSSQYSVSFVFAFLMGGGKKSVDFKQRLVGLCLFFLVF